MEGSMTCALCMLDEYGYKHTLRYGIITAFPQQQWLHECASLLCYMYIACLVLVLLNNADTTKEYTTDLLHLQIHASYFHFIFTVTSCIVVVRPSLMLLTLM
jgi:hypothetical protein